MSLIKSLGDSNSASSTSNFEENSGPSDAGHLGYVLMPFPSQMPAQSNGEVGITKDLSLSQVNQGTSLGSYSAQPETPSSKSGK